MKGLVEVDKGETSIVSLWVGVFVEFFPWAVRQLTSKAMHEIFISISKKEMHEKKESILYNFYSV